MKILLENWNKFVHEEIDVPPGVEKSDADTSANTLKNAEKEADLIDNKLDSIIDPETKKQSIEIIVKKLLDLYKKIRD